MTNPKHAAAFANGMEYFNTYGGCTAAGAAGMATLKVIQVSRCNMYITLHVLHAFSLVTDV